MPNLVLPPRFIQRDACSRLAIEPLTVRGEPCVLARVWSRSPASPDEDESYAPTGAAIAFPVRDLETIVRLLEDAARSGA